jgi:hypothetical protein
VWNGPVLLGLLRQLHLRPEGFLGRHLGCLTSNS